VAYAIAMGVLDRRAIPADVLNHVARIISFYESERAESWGGRSPLERRLARKAAVPVLVPVLHHNEAVPVLPGHGGPRCKWAI